MSNQRREEKEQEKAIDRTIDQTRESTKKVLQEVKRELPEVTSTFHDYQEQNINAIRDMTTIFLESQKEVAKSMQSALRPYSGNAISWILWPWMHPQIATENYVKGITNFADSSVAAARMSSDLMQIQMDSVRTSIEMAHNNTRALSRYFVDVARTFEERSKS